VLGGVHNFPVDREAAERIRAQSPDLEDAAWVNRGFHQRAARWMAAEQGIRQFIDIGSGLPARGSRTVCAALCVACGLAVLCTGCAATARLASHSSAVEVRAASSPVEVRAAPKRFCAYEIATPTAAEIAAINRYWTPLARSAVRYVSEGKMLVPVPKKHLTPAQRQALHRAEWAWRTYSPKPRLVCEQMPAGRYARGGANRSPDQAPPT